MAWLDRFRRRPAGTVVIPEGHQVVTVGPSPEPCVARTESGALIADFGPRLAAGVVFERVEQHLRAGARGRTGRWCCGRAPTERCSCSASTPGSMWRCSGATSSGPPLPTRTAMG